jgi:signal transduction histidine kinase
MPATRVYVRLEKYEDCMLFTLKNISESLLNVEADELTERFIRGDVARTTEGSGLGLSIAKNLTTLQNGDFHIYLDGDLFKVMLTYEVVDRLKGSPAETKTE